MAGSLRLQAEIAQQAILDFFKTAEEMQDKLNRLQGEVNGHHVRTNAFRTGGGAAAIVGGACFLLAPFTGGTSLLVGGAVAAGAGAAAGIGSTVGGMLGDRDHMNRFQDLAKQLQTEAENVAQTVVVLVQMAALQRGMSADEIARTTIAGLSVALQIGTGILAGIEIAIPVSMTIINAAKMTPAMLEAAKASFIAARQAGISVAAVTVEGAGASVVETSMAASALSASTTGKIFGSAAGGLGAIMGIYEMVTGIKNLVDGPALTGHLETIRRELERTVEGCKNTLQDVEAVLNSP
eukprot:gb/GFBE01005980.1/.p1 GENE.gb/GFBE01005980.1/~~gb/GFBE01005980.1/.p1  ORF type:complete len:295 (+),score=74.27 gb/GFBE01005980.1/:1-885(+)